MPFVVFIMLLRLVVRQVFELLADAVESNAHVLCRNADDGTNLLVADVLEPEQNNGTIERLKPNNTLVQHLCLLWFPSVAGEERMAHVDPFRLAASFRSVQRDARVERHTVDPRLHIASALKVGKSLPQADEHLLK